MNDELLTKDIGDKMEIADQLFLQFIKKIYFVFIMQALRFCKYYSLLIILFPKFSFLMKNKGLRG